MNRILTAGERTELAPALATCGRAGEAHLRILQTTDIHAHLWPYDYYADRPAPTLGLAQTSALIDALRAEAPNTLLLDNGDFLQGNPMGDFVAYGRGLSEGDLHPVIAALNALGFAASTLGNHEFNYGLEFLERALAGAAYPVVSANIARRAGAGPRGDLPFVPPYVILERELAGDQGARLPIRIGIIGFLPPQVVQWDGVHLQGRLVTRDIVQAARAWVPQMREEGADLVIALCHSGIGSARHTEGMENAAVPLAAVPGIDVLLTGHQHLVFPSPAFAGIAGVDPLRGTLHGKPAVMAGCWGERLGLIDLRLAHEGGSWRVLESAVSTRALAALPGATDASDCKAAALHLRPAATPPFATPPAERSPETGVPSGIDGASPAGGAPRSTPNLTGCFRPRAAPEPGEADDPSPTAALLRRRGALPAGASRQVEPAAASNARTRSMVGSGAAGSPGAAPSPPHGVCPANASPRAEAAATGCAPPRTAPGPGTAGPSAADLARPHGTPPVSASPLAVHAAVESASTRAVLAASAADHAATLAYIRRPVGHSAVPLHSFFALVSDDPSLRLVNEAQAAHVRRMLRGSAHEGLPVLSAAAPFKAGGRGGPHYYTDVPAGEIAIRHVADLYLYPNTLRALLLTGAQLREWLERAAGLFNRLRPGGADQPLLNPAFPGYNFDVIGGLSYEIDLEQPSRYHPVTGALVAPGARRIRALRHAGHPVLARQRFILATNSYRAAGGGNFPGAADAPTVFESPDSAREVITRHLAARPDPAAPCNEPAGWRFRPLPRPTSVLFETGPAARAHLGALTALRLEPAGDSSEGFARFRLHL